MEQDLTKKSTILEKEGIILKPDYSIEEIDYISGLQKKFENSRNMRDSVHDELDGMNFVQAWDANEKAANTYLKPKINKEDTTFQSGTIRSKLFNFLSSILNLDLSPDIHAYGSTDIEQTALGQAMEGIIEKTEELDTDAEKKMLRHYELLKHGYVFIEELWEERWGWSKPLTQKFEGMIKNTKWKKIAKLLYAKPTRNIIPGINVYLGDITQYDFTKQPYVFTVTIRPYYEAEGIYKNWERWKYVTKQKQEFFSQNPSMLYNTWRLTEVQEFQVEEIKYQDWMGNEYAVVLNGVLMTPVGMPLPWGWEGSNLVQQNLEPVHAYWAYGSSLVKKLRTNVAVLDELLKLGVLKTQKSFIPPRFNLSGRVVSQRMFMPGKITTGINPLEVPPADQKETQGITSSELSMIGEITKTIDAQSSTQSFAMEPKGKGGAFTEAQILEQQRQAKLSMAITIFACSTLEWKLSWLRLFNILTNWFEPVDTEVDEMRGVLKNKYRTANVPRNIEGKGSGRMLVMGTQEQPTAEQVRATEEDVTTATGQPTRIIAINPDDMKKAKHIWQITVNPREKKSSELSKVLFRGMLADIQLFGQDINIPYLEEQFATIWDKDPAKLFKQGQQQPQQDPNAPPGAPGQGPPVPGGKVGGLPNPEQAIKTGLTNALAQ